ncbi:Ribonuclease III domain-containing protein RNC1, chloroplastic [Glycine soja]
MFVPHQWNLPSSPSRPPSLQTQSKSPPKNSIPHFRSNHRPTAGASQEQPPAPPKGAHRAQAPFTPNSTRAPQRFILTRPLDDKRVADRFLSSPQLALNTFPFLSSCLPFAPLGHVDNIWMEKHALGYPLEPSVTLRDDSKPARELDTLLYLAFQHEVCEKSRARHVRFGHSRLFFLGQYVLELAFADYFLQRSVFWALFGAIYLCFGMPEVYRVLFEVFGMDPDAEDCQPKLYALFAHPRLFRACVPPSMHQFRGNLWDYDCRPQIMQVLGYPLKMKDRIPEITKARNIELDLGLQLCFLHPSKYKFDHPQFFYERLEYLGQKIQDSVMAERLLMKHLDAPGLWLQNRHRRLKYPVTTTVKQALHGLSYVVYGKRDVRRLMFEVFDFEQTQLEAK